MVDGISRICQDLVNHPNRHLQIGYLDIWIMVTNLLLHPQSGLLCGAALPGFFFSRKNTSLVFLQPKNVFLVFYLNNL